MTTENNVIIVNKQELIQAALKMEKQGFYLSFLLLTCYAQLEDIHRKLETVMYECEFSQTRRAFLNLFMGKEEWDKLISDAQVREWQAEFESGSFCKDTQDSAS